MSRLGGLPKAIRTSFRVAGIGAEGFVVEIHRPVSEIFSARGAGFAGNSAIEALENLLGPNCRQFQRILTQPFDFLRRQTGGVGSDDTRGRQIETGKRPPVAWSKTHVDDLRMTFEPIRGARQKMRQSAAVYGGIV